MRAIGVRTTTRAIGIMIVASAAIAACAARMPSTRTHGAAASPAPSGLEQIETIVVIYAENRSFDNLYGSFPGANGMANAANVPKVAHGGWFPLTIAAIAFTVLITWQRGRAIVTRNRVKEEGPLRDFVEEVREADPYRSPGTGIFLNANTGAYIVNRPQISRIYGASLSASELLAET